MLSLWRKDTKINKIDKALVRLIKRKQDTNHQSHVQKTGHRCKLSRNWEDNIRILQSLRQQPEKLNKMNIILQKHNLPKLTQEETEKPESL